MRSFLVFLLTTNYLVALAQYKPKENYKYDWAQFEITDNADKELEQFHHYIVDEKVGYIVTNKAAGDYTIAIKKQLRIKFNKTPPLSSHSIILPETFDPNFDFRIIPESKKYMRYGPAYYNHKITLFASRIIKENGDTIDGIQRLITKVETKYRNRLPLRLYWYQYDVSTIQAGDLVDIIYRVEIPYYENPKEFNCQRIFFNSDDYKKKSSIYLSFPNTARAKLDLVNGLKITKTEETRKRTRYWFDLENLAPNISEINGRPHLTLPHLVVNATQSGAWIATSGHNGVAGYMPYWVYAVAGNRNTWHPSEKRRVSESIDKQNKLIDAFTVNSTKHIPDSLKFAKMCYLHNLISDSFNFQNDWASYAGWDLSLQNVGTNVEKRNLRQISRYNLYHKLFYNIEIPYYTTYLIDNRVGAISDKYMSPIIGNERCYSVATNNRLVHFYPKKSRYGYAVDEIPFYWENSTQILIYFNRDISPENMGRTVFTKMPASDVKENYRSANTQCNVKTESQDLYFKTLLALSGQFSTMTRGVYLYDHADSSINKRYQKKIFEHDGRTILTSQELISKANVYPFRASFSLDYESKANGSSIALKNWFPHIVESSYEAQTRTLPFYFDFLFNDSFRYFIEFDQPIDMVEFPEDVLIESSAGFYKFTLTQMNDTTLLLHSIFIVNKQVVNPEHSLDLEEIFEQIKKINQSKIVYKTK